MLHRFWLYVKTRNVFQTHYLQAAECVCVGFQCKSDPESLFSQSVWLRPADLLGLCCMCVNCVLMLHHLFSCVCDTWSSCHTLSETWQKHDELSHHCRFSHCLIVSIFLVSLFWNVSLLKTHLWFSAITLILRFFVYLFFR